MPQSPSVLTTILFLGLLALLLGAVALVLLKVRRPSWMAWLLGAYVLIPLLMAWSGLLGDWERRPPLFPVLVGGVSLTSLLLALCSPVGRRLLDAVPLTWLVGFQSFRFPLELLLHRLHIEGALPVQMTYEGWNFDILSGISALLLCFFLRRGPVSRAWLWIWNLVSLGLLITIVSVALVSTPMIQAFDHRPLNTLVTQVPWILLPTVYVQAALFGHLLVFRRLLAAK